jgi:hypothetical protein
LAEKDLREATLSAVGKPDTFCADLLNLPPALLPLTSQERWVCWQWQLRTAKNGQQKWTKLPRQPRSPEQNAKSNDATTWGPYRAAVDALVAGEADGIGFMLAGSDIGAGDLDHVRDPDSGALEPWAEQLCAEASAAYREVTVSGTGLRFIGKVRGPEIHRKFTFDRQSGAGLELYRDTARYITVSGLEIGTCAELPPIDNLIDTLFARFTGRAQQRTEGMGFNDTGRQQSSTDFEHVIRNGAPEGERSELFQGCVWHLASKGWTAEKITDELARRPNGIGAKYAPRLHSEVERSYEKWRAHRRAGVTGSAASANDPWPKIYVIPSELPRVVNEAEQALLLLNHEIYQRGELLVRPVLSKLRAADNGQTLAWRLIPITRPYMVETLTRAARFLRYDGRAKGFVPIDAPDKVADTYLARMGGWKLPILAGIVNTPFLRIDRSLCDQPGYDQASGLLFHPDGQAFPAIAASPSRADAKAAVAYLDKVIATFPFVSKADRAVALSGILTALDRRCMATAPLHAFASPVAGSGKSLLVDLAAMVATGQPAPVIAQGRTEEELEKRVGTALMNGDAIISIDNCEHPIESTFLCQALTQQRLKIRVLGQSRQVEIPINAAFYATGNNLEIANDLTRRTLLCTIDAHCERPELRTFDTDIHETVRANRGRLVAAALTVLRAWHLAHTAMDLPPFGSFAEWSQRIREPLVWLDRADPCDTMVKVRDNDPRRTELGAVLARWKEVLGVGSAYTLQQVINAGINNTEFHAALVAVAAPNRGGFIVSSERLGRWLRKVEGKIVNDLTLARGVVRDGYQLWKVTSAGAGQ